MIILFLICNILFSLLYLKKLNTPFRRLFYFLIWNLIIEILSIVFTSLGHNNLPLLHIYTLGEFVLFSYFFISIITFPRLFRTLFWWFVGIGALFIVINSLFFQSIYDFNTYAKSFSQVSIIGYAVMYFYNLVTTNSFASDTMKSLRLINSAILIYYSGSLFIFMYGRSMEVNEWYIMLWAFNAVLNLIFHLLIFIGLWKAFYKKSTS